VDKEDDHNSSGEDAGNVDEWRQERTAAGLGGVSSQLCYSDYTLWCKNNGKKAASHVGFGRKLSAAGVPTARRNDGVHYVGLRLRPRKAGGGGDRIPRSGKPDG